MTDEITPQTQQPPPKKDEKKPASVNNRGPKRNVSNARPPAAGGTTQGAPRPSSRTGNKKSPPNAPPAESGSDTTSRKVSESGRKPEQRNKNQSGAGRATAPRKAQSLASQGGRNTSSKDQPSIKQSSSPAPAPSKEASDALSSLQRVIADLKTTSPTQSPSNNSNAFAMTAQQELSSNLPPNAPVFQPGAAAYPGLNPVDPKHRKAASLGTSGLSGNFNSFSPHLGAMMEDAEDGPGNASFEDGEIQDSYYSQPGHQPRSQSQSFMAPRFAALAAQQEQVDSVGPTGRPQLAPGFMFGARKRGGPMGPPINEEDVGFQFPQQQQQNFQPEAPPHEQTHKKSDSGEITGIMAEQVHHISIRRSAQLKIPNRSPCRVKLRLYNNNNKPYISSSLPRTRFYPFKPLDLLLTEELPTDGFRVQFLLVLELPVSLVVYRTLWVSLGTWLV